MPTTGREVIGMRMTINRFTAFAAAVALSSMWLLSASMAKADEHVTTPAMIQATGDQGSSPEPESEEQVQPQLQEPPSQQDQAPGADQPPSGEAAQPQSKD